MLPTERQETAPSVDCHCNKLLVAIHVNHIMQNTLTLTLPGPSAGVSGSLDSYW